MPPRIFVAKNSTIQTIAIKCENNIPMSVVIYGFYTIEDDRQQAKQIPYNIEYEIDALPNLKNAFNAIVEMAQSQIQKEAGLG